MKKMKNLLIVVFLSFAVISCEDFSTDLNVENVEDPSSEQLGSEATAAKLFQNWYVSVNEYNGPGLSMAMMSDSFTCSWGNAAMRDTSSEPRTEWNNSDSYSNQVFTNKLFNSMHVVLADANGVIFSIENGGSFSDKNKVKAIAKMAQGLSIGYLALNFDKVWLSDETGALNDGNPVSYKEAITFALKKLDDAISIANANTFTVDAKYFNEKAVSSSDLAKIINSFAARILVNSVRNSTQRDALDWTAVKNYASNGISEDFKIAGDGWNSWINEWSIYATFPGWARVDMRIINLMDTNTISYWTSSNPVIPESTSADARLLSDFEYLSSQNFIPSRGIYHFSSYRYKRYDWYRKADYKGDFPEMLVAEIELYKAEALLRTNNLNDAAAILNATSNPRKSRGNLPDVAVNATDIAAAIHYERLIEIMCTSSGLPFYEMRKENLLQAGTPLHYPVPGKQLQAAKIDNYTFGGSTGTAGEDYSTGGWR